MGFHAWIDAKHFFGADLKFPKKKTQKQVDRYVTEYGHGALVYRHGFCDGLRLRGAIKLDSSPLDLKPLEDFHENSKSYHYRNSPTLLENEKSITLQFLRDFVNQSSSISGFWYN